MSQTVTYLLVLAMIAVVLVQATAFLCLTAQEIQFNQQGEALTRSVTCRDEFGYRRKCSPAALRKFEQQVLRHSITE
jgi:hypothetical protein